MLISVDKVEARETGGGGGGNKSKCYYYFCNQTPNLPPSLTMMMMGRTNHTISSPYLDGKYHQSTTEEQQKQKQTTNNEFTFQIRTLLVQHIKQLASHHHQPSASSILPLEQGINNTPGRHIVIRVWCSLLIPPQLRSSWKKNEKKKE